MLNETSELTVSTKVITHYNYSNYTTATVSSAVGTTSVHQQQMTITQYKTKIRSKTVDIEFSVNKIPLTTSATHMYTSRVPYPAVTDHKQGITDPQLSTTAQTVVMSREAVAWALFSLMTLLFIGILSLNVTILCIQKYRQKQDNTARATVTAYEMDGNPCYESSKIDHNTNQTNLIYEQIESDRV